MRLRPAISGSTGRLPGGHEAGEVHVRDLDRYHRFVGDCRRADGVGVASWMVEHGQALDWPRYSHGAHAEQQESAEAGKAGL
jgi:endonuclease YncB( thermonuclease family)